MISGLLVALVIRISLGYFLLNLRFPPISITLIYLLLLLVAFVKLYQKKALIIKFLMAFRILVLFISLMKLLLKLLLKDLFSIKILI